MCLVSMYVCMYIAGFYYIQQNVKAWVPSNDGVVKIEKKTAF